MLLRCALAGAVLSMTPLDALPVQASSGPTARGGRAPSVADTGASVVVGTVFDSVANVPLAGAVVQLLLQSQPATVHTAMTDSVGSYRLMGVGNGRYLATFFHPALDTLGLKPPLRLVDVTGNGETVLNLAIPSAARVAAALCPGATPGDSTGSLLGYVRDADTDLPLPGSTVVVLWNEIVIDERGMRRERVQVPATVGADGWYKICGLPTDAALIARAEHGADSSGFIEIRVPPRGVLTRSFGIGRADSVVSMAVDSAGQEASARSTV
ncbi:MAG: MSCRAMM family protein, partial [Gemmatimonadaceae bacterium]